MHGRVFRAEKCSVSEWVCDMALIFCLLKRVAAALSLQIIQNYLIYGTVHKILPNLPKTAYVKFNRISAWHSPKVNIPLNGVNPIKNYDKVISLPFFLKENTKSSVKLLQIIVYDVATITIVSCQM